MKWMFGSDCASRMSGIMSLMAMPNLFSASPVVMLTWV